MSLANSALRRSEAKWGFLYAAPAMAFIIAFVGYPLGSLVYHSFTKWDGLSEPKWIGLHNFGTLLSDPVFRNALINNCLFALTVPLQVTVPLALAYLIHRQLPGWRWFRTMFFLPAILSTVVVGLIASLVLQLKGPLNEVLSAVGLQSLTHDWLASSKTSIPMIILVVFWANFGYNVLIYLGGMSVIDPSMREAALIDGARNWTILTRIYAPNLRRVMELVLVTSTVTAFAYMFTYVYTITNGGPGYSTYTTEFYAYSQAFASQNLGYASAVGLALMLLLSAIGFIQIRLLTRDER